ncbi:Ig alpha chain C region [Frankliniella fusca]|uniref:Ig alpha chain C region n=1 Tax=Frankliniella fusca TaxID=407009 RepID=A0AAE1H1V5_9NEOP|nr:Ig alpha chain C region [Frankliniella fusca]
MFSTALEVEWRALVGATSAPALAAALPRSSAAPSSRAAVVSRGCLSRLYSTPDCCLSWLHPAPEANFETLLDFDPIPNFASVFLASRWSWGRGPKFSC